MNAGKSSDLKSRWSIKDFSYRTEYRPGDFCVFITEWAPPPCGSGVECDGYFDSTQDFLAWLRYCQVPYLVSWNCGNGDNYTIEGDEFLTMCSDSFREDVTGLIALLDAALAADDPDESVDEIVETVNAIFGHGTPAYEISAAGRDLLTFLSDPFLSEKLDEAVENENDESGARHRLRKLTDEATFDERNKEHVRLARKFLQSCRSF